MVYRLSSCCCYDLKTGSSIIAVLGLLAYIGITISEASNLGIIYENSDNSTLITVFICMLLAGIINLIFYALLVCGTAKSHPGCIKAWLVFMYITLWVDVIFSCGSIYFFDVDRIIFSFSRFLLNLYFVSVVRSYLFSLLQNQNKRKFSKQTSTKEDLPPPYDCV